MDCRRQVPWIVIFCFFNYFQEACMIAAFDIKANVPKKNGESLDSNMKKSASDSIPVTLLEIEGTQKRLLRRNSEESTSINDLTNYDFEYQIHGGGNFFGHAEKRNGKETKGQYFVVLPDFRRQLVKYYVDSAGYHATVSYQPITSFEGKSINIIPSISLGPGLLRRKKYKKVVRKRVPKRRRSHAQQIL